MSNALEQKARRAAKRAGLIPHKSRWRRGTVDNHGGFMLRDLYTNFPVAGYRYEMTAEDVIKYCAE